MKKYKKQILSAVTLVLFIVFILSISPKTMQNDTFWSIKVGERIVKEGVFGIDYFSIHEGLYYIAHHFLTDVLIYIVHYIAGFKGLYILEVVIALVMAGLLYLLNKEISSNKYVSIFMLFFQLCIMSMYIAVRAHMVSYILFILELILLEKYMKKNKIKYIIGLSVIPILLANFHMGAVPFYFVILGVYIISLISIKVPVLDYIKHTDKTRIKQLLIVGTIGGITIFVNPYFIDGVIYPFKTFGNSFINSNIAEFQSYSFTCDGGLSLFYIFVILLVLIISKNKPKTRDFLLIFGTLFMGFVAIRYVSLFVICSGVILRYLGGVIKTINLSKLDKKTLLLTGQIVIILISLISFANNLANGDMNYIPSDTYPIQAVEFLKEKLDVNDRIFSDYAWGSYLMLNDIKVYIDSRCDLYTKEYNGTDIANDYIKLTKCDKNYKEIIKKYRLNTFIIPVNEPLETLLEENDEFDRIYRDDVAAIYKQI